MSYDRYFINHTKREIVYSKINRFGFEDNIALGTYFGHSEGDLIEISGEQRLPVEEALEKGYCKFKIWYYRFHKIENSETIEDIVYQNLLYDHLYNWREFQQKPIYN